MFPNFFVPIGYTTLVLEGQDPLAVDLPTGPPPDPSSTPDFTAVTQWPVKPEDTDIALTAPLPPEVIVGSTFKIDDEEMTVVDISNPDNPGVDRAVFGTGNAEHEAGATVEIWLPLVDVVPTVVRIYNACSSAVSVIVGDEPSLIAYDYGVIIPPGAVEYLSGGSVLSAMQIGGTGTGILYISVGN